MVAKRIQKGKGPLIFVVDDEEDMVDILYDTLTQNGYIVETFGDGVGLIKRLQEQVPALIMLDIMLPGIDGFKLCANLRSNSQLQNIKLILISGKITMDEVKKGYAAGCDYFMAKPFQLREMLKVIQKFLASN